MSASDNTLLTPQAAEVYDLLEVHHSLTAAEIGKRLHILPNAVYRVAQQLIELGVARKVDTYPVRFELVASDTALAWYMLLARRNFLENFPPKNSGFAKQGGPNITFIKDRKTLLVRTDKDATASEHSINFIVSGLEVPDETVLAYRGARQRGVVIRALVQQKQETSQSRLEQWRDIGVDVRAIGDLRLRLFVFDSRIAYFTSYSTQTKNQAFGVRFEYPPIATVMDELFENHWAAAIAI